MITMLLDADIVAYQLAATHQRTYRWPGLELPSVIAEDASTLPERIDQEVNRLARAIGAHEIIVCLSCPTAENFRMSILPTYKGNRAASVKPVYLSAVKDYMEATWRSYRKPTLEADDIMGILSTHPTLIKGTKVIVSEDKDMLTIPGMLYNPNKDWKPRLIDREQADYWHAYQTIVGDSTDGYSGCPGAGPVKAEKVLHAPNGVRLCPWAAWQATVALYETKKLTEEDALVQARVARICRAEDYDFTNQKVIPWNPPTDSNPRR